MKRKRRWLDKYSVMLLIATMWWMMLWV